MTNTTDTLTTADLVAGISRVMLHDWSGFTYPAVVREVRRDEHGILVTLFGEGDYAGAVTLEAAEDERWQAAALTTGERRMYAAAAAVADALLEGVDPADALQEYAVARFAYVDR